MIPNQIGLERADYSAIPDEEQKSKYPQKPQSPLQCRGSQLRTRDNHDEVGLNKRDSVQ
jgi:hypothetical protein